MKKIKFGIIGTAGIAWKSTLPGMKAAEGCELYAIAGRDEKKVAQYQMKFDIPCGYIGYDQILEDPLVEAVYIPLSNQLHKKWCIKAAKAKKHILCEKPLAPTAEDLKEILAVCEENNVKIMEAFPYVHAPLLARIKEVIASGEIGNVQNVSASFFTPRHPISNVRMRRETLGGSIYDLGCYNTSFALEVFGKMPEAVHASATFTEEHIDDYAAILMNFGNGRRAASLCGMVLSPGNRKMACFVYGEKGGLEVADSCYNIPGEIALKITANGTVRTEIIHCPDPYALETEQFCRCIRDEEPYRFSHEESLWNAAVLDMALTETGYYAPSSRNS